MKTDLLKEAIADADAIKKLAIENAKASLNESFDSKIKSMLAAKLQEDADQDMEDMEEEYDETDEAKKMDMEDTDETKHSKMDDEDTDESFDIDAILAEMEGDEEDDMKHEAKKKKASEEDEEDEKEEEGEDEMEEPKASKGKKSSDDEDESGEDQMEETIDLDALIAEMMGEAEDDEVDEGSYSDDEVDETYAKDEDEMDEAKDEDEDEVQKMKEELYEIKRQAKQLAAKVNETNLINAKLLYLNKVLRNHTLSEQQKIKVVAAFDKASSVKEAKIVFESLNEALNIKSQNTKTSLKESLGFASKATGTSTKREIISESFADKERWQKLANIRK
jgi:hypothetical protein